jgi:hypothetical protein
VSSTDSRAPGATIPVIINIHSVDYSQFNRIDSNTTRVGHNLWLERGKRKSAPRL